MREFDPGNCLDCPVLQARLVARARLKADRKEMVQEVVHPERQAKLALWLFDVATKHQELIAPEIRPYTESPLAVAEGLRHNAEAAVEALDDDIQVLEAGMRQLIADCPGPTRHTNSSFGQELLRISCNSPHADSEPCPAETPLWQVVTGSGAVGFPDTIS